MRVSSSGSGSAVLHAATKYPDLGRASTSERFSNQR